MRDEFKTADFTCLKRCTKNKARGKYLSQQQSGNWLYLFIFLQGHIQKLYVDNVKGRKITFHKILTDIVLNIKITKHNFKKTINI